MIVKNICPYPKVLKDLGNKHLMPGEECDLSSFTQKERDNCVELQEGFRKGELICIGMNPKEPLDHNARLRIARARILQNGPPQPLMEVPKAQRISSREISKLDLVTNPSEKNQEDLEELPERPKFTDRASKRPVPSIFDQPTGIMERDQWGRMVVRPLPVSKPTPKSEPQPEFTPDKRPTITPDRIREIMAQKCISYRTDGKKCKRWAVNGSEYCITHMPAEEREKYKQQKKQQFFKD